MDNLQDIANNAIERYFNSLSKFGYKKYSDVNKLLVLLFIEELLTGELSFFINECDYRSIINVLYCIFGSTCLIDLPSFDVYDNIYHKDNTKLTYRITEDWLLRDSEHNLLRIME